ncbi:CRM-domain containing factor CFM3 [Cucumis melo var. makuwa]|uniref:CRM-domain containing factor CFM3, chloroplastic/mitochondrial n=2 Tax=Cucumis melo TaxID=3656 RepID=A0A1S3B7C2_CUCME|nr:CRM-domain containing factor CFM9, mitochondrial [Cucumis melo]KAA0053808.1 CRM-domain containing factor CFM3 [Cucumis melo var. makuwa]TYK25593.1 CRM-domain containing factor CFM3 [Cucumis melo var. makuwa]
MAKSLFHNLRRASLLFRSSSLNQLSFRPILVIPDTVFSQIKNFPEANISKPLLGFRNLSHGSVNLVVTQGKPKFETHVVDPPKKEKWKTKKKLKMQRMRSKQKRKAANKRDPRQLRVKGKKKQKFPNAAERIKNKLERARIKEALLIERLKRYEVPEVQGPIVKPHNLTAEERFYIKKMGQKRSNYVPIGRRGVFGGVILNMHMHWKKHETVKVYCKPCKPGQVHEYAQEIARLSGGIPIQIIGDDTIIFYRGKEYVQPEVMSPIGTLSKKRALEKSKYEQSLESVRRFIAIAEKELELYYRHIALYGDPNDRNPLSILNVPSDNLKNSDKHQITNMEDSHSAALCLESDVMNQRNPDFSDDESLDIGDEFGDACFSTSESDFESDKLDESDDGRIEVSVSQTEEMFSTTMNTCSAFQNKCEFHKQELPIHS